jgi:hypothetical protein
MMNRPTFVVLCCFMLAMVATATPTSKERLLRDILRNYESAVDPGNIRLKFNVALMCSTYDKLSGLVVSSVWESQTWKDERLTWTPSEYDGLDQLRIPSKLVWTPDLRQYYSVTPQVERDEDINVVLQSDGTVTWIPRAVYRTKCAPVPADDDNETAKISCDWRIGSWTYDGNNVGLEVQGQDGLDLSQYMDSCPLVVESHKADVVDHVYPCCEEPYPSLDMSIVFKPRK